MKAFFWKIKNKNFKMSRPCYYSLLNISEKVKQFWSKLCKVCLYFPVHTNGNTLLEKENWFFWGTNYKLRFIKLYGKFKITSHSISVKSSKNTYFFKAFPMVDTLKQAGISSHRAEVNKKAVVHYLHTLHLTTSCINLCQYCKNRRLTLLLHQNTRLL